MRLRQSLEYGFITNSIPAARLHATENRYSYQRRAEGSAIIPQGTEREADD